MSQVELSFDDRGPASPRVLRVAELVRAADRILGQRFSNLWVEGEVSNLKLASSGHAYFTLKDDEAALPVVMWRTAVSRLRFRLESGQALRVLGKLGIFDRQGRFQMYADRAEPAGLGALMLELEQRKARLAAEGLFDPDRKRPLPRWPRVIGVVTSRQGAALHDILEVARQRRPGRILLSPALVQGDAAPASLRRALGRLVAQPGVDVVILGRGGGSVEDLWAFNDEALARAVAACPVPIVSAVGHEVDVSICDLVADVRAATPSHAAELVVPDLESLERRLQDLERRLARALERRALDARIRLDRAVGALGEAGRDLASDRRERLRRLVDRLRAQHPERRIHRDRRLLATLESRLVEAGGRLTRAPRLRLARAAGALDALSPLAVLERGFAVVTDRDAKVIVDAAATGVGDTLHVRLHRGSLVTRVVETRPVGDAGSEPTT